MSEQCDVVDGARQKFPQISVLGLPIHTVQIPDVVRLMAYWLNHERSRLHWIAIPDVHGVIRAHKDAEFKKILLSADLIVPDGISMVWVARCYGIQLKKRVSGTDLMQAFFTRTQGLGVRHYFYGDTEPTLVRLAANLCRDYHRFTLAGWYSPPFRSLTSEEDEAVIQQINAAKPDVLWVGLGLPKQEQWIVAHRDRLAVPVVLGVGAAFKFLSGTVKRCPAWVGDCGFEWLWRLVKEPQRLRKRLLIEGPQFIGRVAMELSGFRKYS
jgi:N-acetylglucosaminyldiphosphoundecaprenol N-acetyl-beta-D-mannosaminyltransferase